MEQESKGIFTEVELFEARTHLATMIMELEQQFEKPPGNDPFIKAFCQAAIELLKTNSDLAKLLEYSFVIRGNNGLARSGPYMANMFFRAMQLDVMDQQAANITKENTGPKYPIGFDAPEVWAEKILTMLTDKGQRRGRMEIILRCFNIQSNVSDRYRTIPMLINMLPHKFSPEPIIVDFGSSLGLGLKRIATLDKYPFSPIETVRLGEDKEQYNLISDQTLQSYINSQQIMPCKLGLGINVDNLIKSESLIDFLAKDEMVERWGTTNSLYPSELLIEDKVRMFQELKNEKPPNVVDMHGDITDPEFYKIFKKRFRGLKVDMVNLCLVAYELPPEKQPIAIWNAIKIAEPNGLVVFLDNIHKSPEAPYGLNFLTRIYGESFVCCSKVIDTANPEVVQDIFDWENARVRKLKLPPGILSIPEHRQAA